MGCLNQQLTIQCPRASQRDVGAVLRAIAGADDDRALWKKILSNPPLMNQLAEMRIGSVPQVGLLLDESLKGLSAEAVYDRIVTDLRRFRRLGTFRGVGLGDILDAPSVNWWATQAGVDLDAFYRNCLAQGLLYHHEQGRGLLPAALIEEIRALNQPPIPDRKSTRLN